MRRLCRGFVVVGLLAVVIVAIGFARRKRNSWRNETCDPATASTWGRHDERPKSQGPSPGCQTRQRPHVTGDLLRRTLMVDGQPRTYVARTAWAVPDEQPAPLVFFFHGSGGSGERVRRFGMEDEARGQAMIVYPDGLPIEEFGGRAGWDLRTNGRDFAFFDQLLAALGDEFCLDLGRVYLTGFSFGGWMTNRLGFARASRLRAIAPVGGGLSPHDCGGPALAALIVHGRNDPVVPFAEGQGAHAMWMKAAGCREGTPAPSNELCVFHQGCAKDAPVGFCVHEEHHSFPRAVTAAIWSFFDRLR